jgi:hypothetical protein
LRERIEVRDSKIFGLCSPHLPSAEGVVKVQE